MSYYALFAKDGRLRAYLLVVIARSLSLKLSHLLTSENELHSAEPKNTKYRRTIGFAQPVFARCNYISSVSSPLSYLDVSVR